MDDGSELLTRQGNLIVGSNPTAPTNPHYNIITISKETWPSQVKGASLLRKRCESHAGSNPVVSADGAVVTAPQGVRQARCKLTVDIRKTVCKTVNRRYAAPNQLC